MSMLRFFKALLSGASHAPLPSSKANIYRFFSIAPFERRIIDLYKNTKQSVVTITSCPKIMHEESESGESFGSGVVWDLEGHIVTNNHVILPHVSIPLHSVDLAVYVLNSNGVEEKYTAEIVGSSLANDIAVMKISAPKYILKPIKVEESTTIEIGQECYLIGAPHYFRHSLISGRISGLNQPSPYGLIQVAALTNPGLSGAPLLNYSGRMIGMHTAGISYGIGVSIPSSIIVKTVTQFI